MAAEQDLPGPSEPYLLELEAGDRWGVLRERLRWARRRPVCLVLGEDQTLLRELVHFRLLRREAIRAGVPVVVVSRRYGLRSLARTAGLESRASVSQALRRMPQARPASAARVLPSASVFRNWHWPSAVGSALGTMAAVVVVGLALAGLLVPQATITLSPASRPLAVRAVLSIERGVQAVDPERFVLPGEVRSVTVDGSAEATTVAAKDVPDARATGQVTFINKRDVPLVVPHGTVVRTSAGALVRFVTQAPAEVPGEAGGRGVAPVQAVDPGPGGNVGPLTINQVEGPLALNVLVINETPTEGGSARSVRVVTEADQERLRQSLLPRLEQEARTGLARSLAEEEILVEDAVRYQVVEETFSHAPNQPAEGLSLRMRLRAEGLVIRRNQVEAWASAYLTGQVAQDHQLEPETLEVNVASTRAQGLDRAQIELEARGLIRQRLGREELRGLVRGARPEEAARRLEAELDLSAPPEIELAGAWHGRLPYLPFRIDVRTVEGG